MLQCTADSLLGPPLPPAFLRLPSWRCRFLSLRSLRFTPLFARVQLPGVSGLCVEPASPASAMFSVHREGTCV